MIGLHEIAIVGVCPAYLRAPWQWRKMAPGLADTAQGHTFTGMQPIDYATIEPDRAVFDARDVLLAAEIPETLADQIDQIMEHPSEQALPALGHLVWKHLVLLDAPRWPHGLRSVLRTAAGLSTFAGMTRALSLLLREHIDYAGAAIVSADRIWIPDPVIMGLDRYMECEADGVPCCAQYDRTLDSILRTPGEGPLARRLMIALIAWMSVGAVDDQGRTVRLGRGWIHPVHHLMWYPAAGIPKSAPEAAPLVHALRRRIHTAATVVGMTAGDPLITWRSIGLPVLAQAIHATTTDRHPLMQQIRRIEPPDVLSMHRLLLHGSGATWEQRLRSLCERWIGQITSWEVQHGALVRPWHPLSRIPTMVVANVQHRGQCRAWINADALGVMLHDLRAVYPPHVQTDDATCPLTWTWSALASGGWSTMVDRCWPERGCFCDNGLVPADQTWIPLADMIPGLEPMPWTWTHPQERGHTWPEMQQLGETRER